MKQRKFEVQSIMVKSSVSPCLLWKDHSSFEYPRTGPTKGDSSCGRTCRLKVSTEPSPVLSRKCFRTTRQGYTLFGFFQVCTLHSVLKYCPLDLFGLREVRNQKVLVFRKSLTRCPVIGRVHPRKWLSLFEPVRITRSFCPLQVHFFWTVGRVKVRVDDVYWDCSPPFWRLGYLPRPLMSFLTGRPSDTTFADDGYGFCWIWNLRFVQGFRGDSCHGPCFSGWGVGRVTLTIKQYFRYKR